MNLGTLGSIVPFLKRPSRGHDYGVILSTLARRFDDGHLRCRGDVEPKVHTRKFMCLRRFKSHEKRAFRVRCDFHEQVRK